MAASPNPPAKFSALDIARKLSALLGDERSGFHADCDGNGGKYDARERAYGYVWVTASNGHRSLVWLDITARGVEFNHHPNSGGRRIMAPNGLTTAQIASFIVSELDRENFGLADATYIRRSDTPGYRPGALESGRVRIIEDQTPLARAALAGAWQDGCSAYPRGFAVNVKNGFIAGGFGSI